MLTLSSDAQTATLSVNGADSSRNRATPDAPSTRAMARRRRRRAPRSRWRPDMPDQKSKLERTGAWALFRLVDAGSVTPRGNALASASSCSAATSRIQFTASSLNNPLSLPSLRQFKCPTDCEIRCRAGLFGKLPAKRDFISADALAAISRGLGALAAVGLATSRQTLGAGMDRGLQSRADLALLARRRFLRRGDDRRASCRRWTASDGRFRSRFSSARPTGRCRRRKSTPTSAWCEAAEAMLLDALEAETRLRGDRRRVATMPPPTLQPRAPRAAGLVRAARGRRAGPRRRRAFRRRVSRRPPVRPSPRLRLAKLLVDDRRRGLSAAALSHVGLPPAARFADMLTGAFADAAPRQRPAMAANSRFAAAAVSDVGQVRELNEDSVLARPEIGLWAVADGMGGYGGGDIASRAVVEALRRLAPDDSAARLLAISNSGSAASTRDSARARAGADRSAVIGTTLVGVLIFDAPLRLRLVRRQPRLSVPRRVARPDLARPLGGAGTDRSRPPRRGGGEDLAGPQHGHPRDRRHGSGGARNRRRPGRLRATAFSCAATV